MKIPLPCLKEQGMSKNLQENIDREKKWLKQPDFPLFRKEQHSSFFLVKYVTIFSEWEMRLIDSHKSNSSSPLCLKNTQMLTLC